MRLAHSQCPFPLPCSLGNGGLANEFGNGQKANTLLGSVVRITDDGGIPNGNPFTGRETDRRCRDNGMTSERGRCQEIYHYGFRNPFRFALNPNRKDKTQLYVMDVGGATWEEINECGSDFPGANYGYREREGPCDRGSKTDCNPDDHDFVDPVYWYEHNEEGDGAVVGGAFVPNGVWPKEYDNKFIFADFVFRKIYYLTEDGANGCRGCTPPRPDLKSEEFRNVRSFGEPLQLTFGPYEDTQALYYSLWAPDGEYTIRRIVYEGQVQDEEENDENENDRDEEEQETGPMNRDPEAVIQVEDRVFRVGENIIFNGRESSDPDGDDLTYTWTFGDNGPGSKISRKNRSYDEPGTYTVSLTVTDERGRTGTTSTQVVVGDPPIPVIISPIAQEPFAVGDVFTLIGAASDADGNLLDDSALTWEVRQHHNTHYHPFLDPTEGNNIVISPAPAPEDFHASTNSFLRVLLTATDSKGLWTTISVDIMPRTKTLFFTTSPPGLQLTLDGFNLNTPDNGDPVEVVTWINHKLVVEIEEQNDLIFSGWSTGIKTVGSETRTVIEVNDDMLDFQADFRSTVCEAEPGAPCINDSVCCSNRCFSNACQGYGSSSLRGSVTTEMVDRSEPSNPSFNNKTQSRISETRDSP